MKTSKKILAFVAMFVLLSTLSFATSKKDTMMNLPQSIHHAVAYPESAKSAGIEGFVLVQYHVTQPGTIKIDAINGSSSLLMNYVINKLSGLYVPIAERKNQYAKFVFKLY